MHRCWLVIGSDTQSYLLLEAVPTTVANHNLSASREPWPFAKRDTPNRLAFSASSKVAPKIALKLDASSSARHGRTRDRTPFQTPNQPNRFFILLSNRLTGRSGFGIAEGTPFNPTA
jgi:hypothetical protein